MPSWLPRREADRLVWLQNFALKLAGYVGTAGITAADVAFVQGARDAYQWLLNRSEQLNTERQEVNEYKRTFSDGPIGTPLGPYPTAPSYPPPPSFTPSAGIFPQIVKLVERIRNSPGYTQAMGEDLGIVPPATTPALDDPVLEAIAQPNSQVEIRWKKGRATGILIESQRGNETTWTVLGVDTVSPYVDTRPPLNPGQPEVRRYRARYVVNDTPVGNYSAIVSVTTIP